MLLGMVLEAPQGTVTLKMIGPKPGVEAERERFSALATSFRVAVGPRGTQSPFSQGTRSLTWLAPEAWRAAPDRPMTEVVYAVAEATSCWVSVLALAAGGVEANIQRWRSQMGGAPVVVQESIPMFGALGSMIEIRGRYAGDSASAAIEDATMLAASCGIDNRTVFVKMIGPREEVQAHRGEFLEFCASLGQ